MTVSTLFDIEICQLESLPREAVNPRRGRAANDAAAVYADVPVPVIVREHEYDIGRLADGEDWDCSLH